MRINRSIMLFAAAGMLAYSRARDPDYGLYLGPRWRPSGARAVEATGEAGNPAIR